MSFDYDSMEEHDRYDEQFGSDEEPTERRCTTCRDTAQKDVRQVGDELMCAACRAELRARHFAQQGVLLPPELADATDAGIAAMIARLTAEVEEEVRMLQEAGCTDAEIVAYLRSGPQ